VFLPYGNIAFVFDPRVYRAEIGLISQGGSNLSAYDISKIFDFGEEPRRGLTFTDRKLKVMARWKNSLTEGGEALEVWTEDIEGDGPSRA
jgi:hypothetical protein